MGFGQSDPSKTEKATAKTRNKQRKDGNVPKGAEIGKAMTLLAGVIALRYLIPYYFKQFSEIYRWFLLEGIGTEATQEKVYELFMWVINKITSMVLPFMLIICFVAYMTMRVQVGKLWTTKIFKPKFGKLFNILPALKKLLISPSAFIRLFKSIGQAAAVGIAPYIVLKQEAGNLVPLFYANTQGIASYMLLTGYKMCCYALIPMMLIAIADLIYTRWNYEEQIKMTKDEVKDERKQAEGDPKVKTEQRRKMLNMMMGRMMEDVPKADVVITNPTHLAVALSYNVLQAPAPMVLAKGAGPVAEKIKDIARENNIPIQENKPLAQALYKQVEIGETIPEELYQAVAAILAKLDKFRSGRG